MLLAEVLVQIEQVEQVTLTKISLVKMPNDHETNVDIAITTPMMERVSKPAVIATKSLPHIMFF